MKAGCVYLVGAGCGKADLITLRGYRRLESCDAVVYDDLIDEALLEAAPKGAERIYVGKRRGAWSMAQEDICAILAAKAREGKKVVRLKGGDPFVFGRGGEEILALQKAGIDFEEIPGITSAIAIPAEAGIPVTHRGYSRGFHVITGATATTRDCLPEGLEQLAKLEDTLVVLMGLQTLPQLTEKLMAEGKPPETPAAVISGGNTDHPCTVRGRLCDIARRVQDAGLKAPAVTVIGQVAALDLRGPTD